MPSRPVTPASPRNARVKSPTPASPMFGCEHVQLLLSQGQEVINSSIAHYKMILHVDSRNGALYCQICDDLVWDPTLEELRLRKIGTGSFSGRKRKHDELFTDSIKDDPRYISSNTTLASCRADGLRGIYNAGATCYQNVVLQSFLHNPLLRNFYLSDGHQSNECNVPHCLSCAMDDMFQDFYALENTNGYTAANILSGFWISEKKAFENLVTTKEQDAHEFFQFLAEDLHERNGDGKKPEIGSEHSLQSFLDLSVGLDSLAQRRNKKSGQKSSNLSLADCLDEEYIKSDKSRRYTSVKRLPNVLSIQLKRFEYKQGRHDHAASKVDVPVHFPLQLNMLPYTNRVRSRDSRENMELQRSCVYDLLSVVVHVGELETGHYTSYCRVGDQWFKFNDHKVELASLSDVLGAQAYLLFYIIRSLA
ncbi:ubiquitin carboxyl-terminal hydrolase [Beauveria bassiana ARSEF 2860]|uniref:Ubiquitin carboxyl-terminal hydrolase n=1 Tax=Beauveria bassiana (strain ARSEF 2860) TaxID=655819 RepID=J5J185_BEAB2|nr:ubiquitin carboxyl-terminal hydrolase [Beauveria bassiana ARSEF 2860]EJP60708.1 ubiquitin carboxyl-terminal hydrolase [Beauveria bassiana ARSEF 2860]